MNSKQAILAEELLSVFEDSATGGGGVKIHFLMDVIYKSLHNSQ